MTLRLIGLATNHSADGERLYAIFPRQRRLRTAMRALGADLAGLRIGQLGVGMGATFRGIRATLRLHVGRVLTLGAKAQMLWPTTRRIVAAVEHAHTCGQWAMRQLPGQAMGGYPASIGKREFPISEGMLSARPYPTLASLVYLTPEGLRDTRGPTQVRALMNNRIAQRFSGLTALPMQRTHAPRRSGVLAVRNRASSVLVAMEFAL